ncbi:transposable element tc3 transposase [Penicillium cinerascens]|uniref:Transposable element tc3 transposase n=1 Tax=Penicillium cinerascens TaxID=70096 RepID=A0A9W9T084_9EURO|nr:transposable element tc3 transposase [Penicillium cinerascens]KAJ5204381.1 transposable element tc3 transposase [Penicillium cinerascens]
MLTTINQGFPLVPASQPRTPTKTRKLRLSYNQVYYTCAVTQQATPRHKLGRKHRLSERLISDTITYTRSDFEIRIKGFDEIVHDLNLPVCGETLRRELQKRDYEKRKAQRKLPLEDKPEARQLRLQWAYEHLKWSYEDWKKVI